MKNGMLVFAMVAAAGCAEPGMEDVSGATAALDLPPFDPNVNIWGDCAGSTADVTVAVPTNIGYGVGTHSGDGFYRTSGNSFNSTGCQRFVVDVLQYYYSNAYYDPNWMAWIVSPIQVDWGAYDLPSSAASALNPDIPNNKIDCERLEINTTEYVKTVGDANFVEVWSGTKTGVWNSLYKVCSVSSHLKKNYQPLGWGAPTKIHRYAFDVSLRGTAQQAGLTVYPVNDAN